MKSIILNKFKTMATGKAGILGKLQGSLDGVTLYNLKGAQVIRKKTIDVFNPQTEIQTAFRNNMSFAINIFNQLKTFLHISLSQRKKKQSLLSEFLRLNLNKSISNSDIDIDNLRISYDSMFPSTFEIDTETNTVSLID